MAAESATFNATEVLGYFERVGFPHQSNFSPLPLPTLNTLRRLIACHLEAIPFENLSLHYSPDPRVSLKKEFLFNKIINLRKGGYCLEQNNIFTTVLRTLGYDLYTIGARVYLPNDSKSSYPGGNIHMAIIVTIDAIEYLVDVGFGGNGLTAPLPIFGETVMEPPIKGVLPEEHRVHRTPLSGGAKKDTQPWVLERRQNPQADWEPVYVFEKDFEFFPGDFEVYSILFSITNTKGSIVIPLSILSLCFSTTLFAQRSASTRIWMLYHEQLYGIWT